MIRHFAIALWLVFGLAALSPAYAARTDVLVVVNDNSIDSPQVGAYYAEQRDIAPANVVHIRAPNQFIVGWNDFRSLRDQILRLGICPTVAANVRPASCSNWALPIYTQGDVDALTQATPIRYIVLTCGVPTRMSVDNSTLSFPTEPTSVDNYLRFWLARYLSSDVVLNFQNRTTALAALHLADWRSRIRPVLPAQDREYVVGRIDGLDLDSTRALVDRTLQSERDGLHGKVYSSTDQGYPWRLHLALFDELRPECANDATNYLSFGQTLPAGKTPVACSVKLVKGQGAPTTEASPGTAASRQPIVDNAVVYFGHLDGQTFDGGFNGMLNWRKNASCSSTLCSTSSNPAACRLASTDVFKEIDTRCVGVAKGFIGYQFISYSAANFNAWPTGWDNTGSGASDAPRIVSNDGADDTTSAFFEKADEVATPACYSYSAGGVLNPTTTTCRATEQVATTQSLPTSGVDPANPQTYKLVFFSRQTGIFSTIALVPTVQFEFAAPTGGCPSATIPLPAAPATPTSCLYSVTNVASVSNSSTWQRFEYTITPPAVAGSAGAIRSSLTFTGSTSGSRLGLDAVSFTRVATGTQLVTNGSFTGGHLQTSTGDYASNVLSRLGGIAYWGSLSHHESSGWSFQGTPLRTLAFLLRGLPLGDAVWLGETHNSGVFYGDPLYSPTQIRIMPLDDPENRITGPSTIQASIKQGTEPQPKQVSLSVCRGGDLSQLAGSFAALTCSASGGWRTMPGTTTVTTSASSVTFAATINSTVFPEVGDYTLRLQVASTDPTTSEVTTLDDYYPIKYRYSDLEKSALYSISGRLLTRDGEPMPYVSVSASAAGLYATTDLQGRFYLSPLRPGTYPLTISFQQGCAFTPINGSSTITITNQSVTQDFQCTDTGGRVSGTIADSAGKPISDVALDLSSSSAFGWAYSNTNGRFETQSLPNGTYTVDVYRDGWTFPSQTVSVQGQRVVLNVTGSTTAPRILGFVRNSQGQPIPGAYLYKSAAGNGPDAYATTNRDGYFESGVTASGAYDMTFEADGFATRTTQITANTSASVTLQAMGRNSISGFVSKLGGVPGVGYRVSLMDDFHVVETTTSAAGFYRFDQVPNGLYIVRVTRPDFDETSVSQSDVRMTNANIIDVNFLDTWL